VTGNLFSMSSLSSANAAHEAQNLPVISTQITPVCQPPDELPLSIEMAPE
jgi:hypothetical protein